MKIPKNKTMIFAVTLFLLLTIAVPLLALPVVNAHTPPWTVPTNSYISIAPNPVGVGQYCTIIVWTDYYAPTSGGNAGQRWEGFRIDITKPDGTNETIGPWTCASALGSDFKIYTPDQVGTYTMVFSWPGATTVGEPGLPSFNAFINDTFTGSVSKPCTLTVQQEPITNWPEAPLPNDYWTRPINALNRGWSTLGSNWLGGSWLVNNFQKWGQAPESPHVLWTKPLTVARAGGIIDAQWPGIPADVNDYESPWSSPIIMDGIIYYNSPSVADSSKYGYYAMDMRTGETLWYKNGTDNGLDNPYSVQGGYQLGQIYNGLTQGWLYHYDSVNGQGVLSYLISVGTSSTLVPGGTAPGTAWYILDAATGNFLLKLINVPSGTSITDENGDLLRYSYNSATGNLLCWNISQSIPPLEPLGSSQQQWKMRFGATIDAVNDTSWTQVGPGNMITGMRQSVPAEALAPRSGYTMNLTVQKGLPGSIAILQDDNRVPKLIFGTYGTNLMTDAQGPGLGAFTTTNSFSAWLMSIDDHVQPYSPLPDYSGTQNTNLGFGATLLWKKDFTVPVPDRNYSWTISYDYDSSLFILKCTQTSQMWGYSLTNGDQIWGPTVPSGNQMDYFGISSNVYYGKVISCSSYGGTITAYDAKDGKQLWIYNATAAPYGYESAYGANMPLSILGVCDGKLYTYSTEHSPTKPLWRESYVRCINITDGTEMWKLLDFNMGAGIADGYIISGNQYDNNIYCIGKGPSATTVSAPQSGVQMGSSFTITGTVTDQSPGAIAYAKKYGAVNGVACVSEESQEAWMEYIYEQQPKPTAATGVQVSIDAIDPNGNYINLGKTASDASGFYSLGVNADTLGAGQGTYKVIATFAGSKSYGSSSSESAFTVSSAPTPSPYPVTVLPPTEMYIVGGVVAIIIAIAIVGTLIMLMLKKRP